MDLERALRRFDASVFRELGRNARITLGMGQNLNVPNAAAPMSRLGAFSKLGGVALNRATVPVALVQTAREVFNPTNNIVTSTQNLITSISNTNKPLSQRALYTGSDPYALSLNQKILEARKTQPNRAPTDAELAAQGFGFGPREYDPFQRPRIAGRDIGGDGRSDEARALASQYAPKPFPMTREGQFNRYFKTPEFDYVFGAQTGKGPKTAEEMVTLGTQRQAPTTAPLSDYYRSQSALGRLNQAAIQEMYKDRPDLQQWAASNPMLAQREYTKKYGTTDITKLAPDEENIMGEFGSRAQNETGYKYGFGFPANPVPPTQQPGPGGMDQGERVSYSRGVENIKPLQALKTTGEGMPAFSTTSGFYVASGSLNDAAEAFVEKIKNRSGAFGS